MAPKRSQLIDERTVKLRIVVALIATNVLVAVLLVWGSFNPLEDAEPQSYLIALLFFVASFSSNSVPFVILNTDRSIWVETRGTVYRWQAVVYSAAIAAACLVVLWAATNVVFFADYLQEVDGEFDYARATTPHDRLGLWLLVASPTLSITLAMQIWSDRRSKKK